MAAKPKYSEQRFQEAIARVRSGQDLGEGDPRPALDPKLQRDVAEAYVQGRKIEDYRQVLEYYGFAWYPIEKLPPLPDGQPHREGQWRSNRHRMAFTSDEICAHFPLGPGEFDRWMKRQILAKRARAAGLVLPS